MRGADPVVDHLGEVLQQGEQVVVVVGPAGGGVEARRGSNGRREGEGEGHVAIRPQQHVLTCGAQQLNYAAASMLSEGRWGACPPRLHL